MRRGLVPVVAAALAAAVTIGCHRNDNTDNTGGATDTIQTGSTPAGGVLSNNDGGASPAMSTTAPVPGTTASSGTAAVSTAAPTSATAAGVPSTGSAKTTT